MTKKRVLIGSPVYQKPAILKRFLASLQGQNQDTVSIDYMFVDDNVHTQSQELFKIILSMAVKNEAERYLAPMLKSLCQHIDEAVIIDDGSSDNTVDICKNLLKGIPPHCGGFPMNIFSHPAANLEYKIKHLGWSTAKDRQAKKVRYDNLDPHAIYGERKQYDTIMDASPVLKEFVI